MKRLLFFVVMLAASASANAQWYVGANVGQSSAPMECGWLKPGNTGNCRSTSLKVLAGYQLNKVLAVEAGYTDFGKFHADLAGGARAAAHATAAELVGVVTLPLSRGFSVFGKAGVADGMSDATTNPDNTFIENNDSAAITFGLGVSYALTRRDSLRGEWQHYNFIGDVRALSVGIVHQF